jgi:hypothetical protein
VAADAGMPVAPSSPRNTAQSVRWSLPRVVIGAGSSASYPGLHEVRAGGLGELAAEDLLVVIEVGVLQDHLDGAAFGCGDDRSGFRGADGDLARARVWASATNLLSS